MKFISTLFVLLLASTSFGFGNEGGGGGDEIRADFMKVGEEAIRFLATDPSGAALADFYQLDIEDLEKTLTINRIAVTEEILKDRTGSVVDAVIRGDKVFLERARWLAILASASDAQYLVFHEMLRLTGINDDDYRISKGFREAVTRRQSLPASTRAVSIVCGERLKNHPLAASRLVFEKRRDHAPRLVLATREGFLLRPSTGLTQKIIRLGNDQFRIASGSGAFDFYELKFDLAQNSAIIAHAAIKSSALKCAATATTSANSRLSISLSLALDYVAEGL